MAHTEYHIDGRYGLFGKFIMASDGGNNHNPFNGVVRPLMIAATGNNSAQFALTRFNRLDGFGVLAADSAGNKFAPLTANLVVPDQETGAPFPLAIFIHGQATSYETRSGRTVETKSYRGYRYLQEYLGDRGIASISVNVNPASNLDVLPSEFDYSLRIQLALLNLTVLFQLVNSPVTTGQPILVKKADGSLVPLQEALALEEPLTTGSPEKLVKTLKDNLAGKISFTNLGFMGHSRGADCAALVQIYFESRKGTAPTNTDAFGPITLDPADPLKNSMGVRIGDFNRHTVLHGFSISLNPIQYHFMMDLMGILGNPTMANVKTLVSLEPSGNDAIVDSPTTFYLVISGSHDPDVEEDSFNEYENVNAPKAMVFSHGANHARFNQVWRRLSHLRRQANQQILCQSPIHMLSNHGHEEIAKATVGNAFLATQLNEAHRLAFFTGEYHATSLGQDISRAWFFPFPFSSPATVKALDDRAITGNNTTTGTAVTPETVYILSGRDVNGHEVFANKAKMNAWKRPAAQTMVLRIPILPADNLVNFTHFSIRYTKEYDAHDATARRTVELKNFTLRLKSTSGTIGTEIQGTAVPSTHQKAYYTKDFKTKCEEDTVIVMQTAEVTLDSFLTPGSHPRTDLNQVNTIEIQLNPPTSPSGDETWFFVDYLLTKRVLPAAPAGFTLP
ncbi:MAG: hypothetical protein H6581_14115 [Bacteroidia bacterium]|nr:hypothetical protein [Bacteroidia bacterium]